MRMIMIEAALLSLAGGAVHSQEAAYELPITVGVFEQQVHRAYTMEQGLPDNDVSRIGSDAHGVIVAVTPRGAAVFEGDQWQSKAACDALIPSWMELGKRQVASLRKPAGAEIAIRAVAEYQGELAVAADRGLYLGNGRSWRMALPRRGEVRWAPVDVRAVAYDASGRLWFAAPQGVGCRISDDEWRLFTGTEGLPYNDFTCMAAGPKGIWFGTTNGAVYYRDGLS